MKKLLSLVVVACVSVSLVGCGKSESAKSGSKTESKSSAIVKIQNLFV